jgi:hypothetical protein
MLFKVMLAIRHNHNGTTLVLQDRLFTQNGFPDDSKRSSCKSASVTSPTSMLFTGTNRCAFPCVQNERVNYFLSACKLKSNPVQYGNRGFELRQILAAPFGEFDIFLELAGAAESSHRPKSA